MFELLSTVLLNPTLRLSIDFPPSSVFSCAWSVTTKEQLAFLCSDVNAHHAHWIMMFMFCRQECTVYTRSDGNVPGTAAAAVVAVSAAGAAAAAVGGGRTPCQIWASWAEDWPACSARRPPVSSWAAPSPPQKTSTELPRAKRPAEARHHRTAAV